MQDNAAHHDPALTIARSTASIRLSQAAAAAPAGSPTDRVESRHSTARPTPRSIPGGARLTPRRGVTLVAMALASVSLAACSASAGSQDSTEPSMAVSEGGAADKASETAPQGDADAGSSAADDAAAGSTQVEQATAPKLARNATMDVTVDDIEKATAQIRSIGRQVDGWVSNEESTSRSTGTSSRSRTSGSTSGTRDSAPSTIRRSGSWAELTLEVPADTLDAAMTDLAEIGEVTRRTASTEDVTSTYTDTETRVATLKSSIARLQDLIDDADDLEQIVELEGKLTERESQLESLTAQLKDLQGRTTMAPITISLSTEAADVEPEEEKSGFVAGLSQGWGAFNEAATAGATVLGALTPFAVTLGALVVLPLYLLRRRMRRGTPSVATTGE